MLIFRTILRRWPKLPYVPAASYKHINSPCSINQNSHMTPRLSGQFFIFGLVFFVLEFRQGIARQWSREKFAILSLKPQSRVINVNISNVGY